MTYTDKANTDKTKYADKKVIIFDLDGTLAESKQKLDPQMSDLLNMLLEIKIVAVMSGGSFDQFKKQFISSLSQQVNLLEKLHLFPTSGTAYHVFEGGKWKEVYSNNLTEEEKEQIIDSIHQTEKAVGIQEENIYGEKVEDRDTQITYSALGQEAPLEVKKNWDPDQQKRRQMTKVLNALLPEFETRIGGATSIDITHKGIDKAYGVRKVEEILNIPISDMLFVGDALYPGGNDYSATKTGIECVRVDSVEDTKELIGEIVGESYK